MTSLRPSTPPLIDDDSACCISLIGRSPLFMLYSISLPILSIAQSSDIMFLNHCTLKSRFICLYTHVDAAMVRQSEYRIGPTPSFFCLISFLASSSPSRQLRRPCSASAPARRHYLREPVGDTNGKAPCQAPGEPALTRDAQAIYDNLSTQAARMVEYPTDYHFRLRFMLALRPEVLEYVIKTHSVSVENSTLSLVQIRSACEDF